MTKHSSKKYHLPWNSDIPVSKEKYEMCINLYNLGYPEDFIKHLIKLKYGQTRNEKLADHVRRLSNQIIPKGINELL